MQQKESLANQGNADIMCILGWGYLSGKYFPKDLDKSLYWLERAIESGNEKAKEFLEYCIFLRNFSK